MKDLRTQYNHAKQQKEDLESQTHTLILVKQKDEQLKRALSSCNETKNSVALQLKELRDAEQHRRQMHNQLMEVRGTICVFCRVRPVPGKEQDNPENTQFIHILVADSPNREELVLRQKVENVLGKESPKEVTFKFDRVFEPKSTQEEEFDEVKMLIQSAFDGYRVCIFA